MIYKSHDIIASRAKKFKKKEKKVDQSQNNSGDII